MKQPWLEDIPAWLFICSDLMEQIQALQYLQTHAVLKDWRMEFVDYWLAKHEYMGDYSMSNSKATERVLLTFVQNPDGGNMMTPRAVYRALDTDVFNEPRLYNELKYRIHNTELRMEFYINIIRKFSIGGRAVMSVFAGSKFTLAAMVSTSPSKRIVQNYVHVYVRSPHSGRLNLKRDI